MFIFMDCQRVAATRAVALVHITNPQDSVIALPNLVGDNTLSILVMSFVTRNTVNIGEGIWKMTTSRFEITCYFSSGSDATIADRLLKSWLFPVRNKRTPVEKKSQSSHKVMKSVAFTDCVDLEDEKVGIERSKLDMYLTEAIQSSDNKFWRATLTLRVLSNEIKDFERQINSLWQVKEMTHRQI